MSIIHYWRRIDADTLAEVLADTDSIEEVVFGRDAGEPFDVEKTWLAIHYLLTGTEDAGEPPAADAVLGGTAVLPEGEGDGDWTRYLTPARVRAVATLLESTPGETLRQRYHPEAMEHLYPHVWGDEDFDDYILPHYEALRTFYGDAAAAGDAMLMCVPGFGPPSSSATGGAEGPAGTDLGEDWMFDLSAPLPDEVQQAARRLLDEVRAAAGNTELDGPEPAHSLVNSVVATDNAMDFRGSEIAEELLSAALFLAERLAAAGFTYGGRSYVSLVLLPLARLHFDGQRNAEVEPFQRRAVQVDTELFDHWPTPESAEALVESLAALAETIGQDVHGGGPAPLAGFREADECYRRAADLTSAMDPVAAPATLQRLCLARAFLHVHRFIFATEEISVGEVPAEGTRQLVEELSARAEAVHKQMKAAGEEDEFADDRRQLRVALRSWHTGTESRPD